MVSGRGVWVWCVVHGCGEWVWCVGVVSGVMCESTYYSDHRKKHV